MTYSYGTAFHEVNVKEVTDLVALSNRRLEMLRSLNAEEDDTTEDSDENPKEI